MFLGFDMQVFQKLLTDNNPKSKVVFLSADEYERIICQSLLPKADCITIQPILQIWDKTVSHFSKMSGFLIIKGIPDYILIVSGYDVESFDSSNIVHEKIYFSNIIHASIVDSITEAKAANSVICFDVLIQSV